MKKIWIIITGVLVLSAAWGIRFHSVNKDVDSPVIQVYAIGKNQSGVSLDPSERMG